MVCMKLPRLRMSSVCITADPLFSHTLRRRQLTGARTPKASDPPARFVLPGGSLCRYLPGAVNRMHPSPPNNARFSLLLLRGAGWPQTKLQRAALPLASSLPWSSMRRSPRPPTRWGWSATSSTTRWNSFCILLCIFCSVGVFYCVGSEAFSVGVKRVCS